MAFRAKFRGERRRRPLSPLRRRVDFASLASFRPPSPLSGGKATKPAAHKQATEEPALKLRCIFLGVRVQKGRRGHPATDTEDRVLAALEGLG